MVKLTFDFSQDGRIAAIEFAAKMSGFLGEAYYRRLFSRPCFDGRPQLKPGVAEIYDYSLWYANEWFFALYLDGSRDEARLCLRPLAEISSGLADELTSIGGQKASERVVLEWDEQLLVALRFESASGLFSTSVLDQAIPV